MASESGAVRGALRLNCKARGWPTYTRDVPLTAPTDYEIDTDVTRLDLTLVHQWLSTDAFWALGRTRETVELAASHSINFGAYSADGQQVGYARVVTDHATFGWLCDVYVDRDHRGHGLGVALTEAVVAHCEPLRLKRLMLSTRDAHELYGRLGFAQMPEPGKLMIHTAADAG